MCIRDSNAPGEYAELTGLCTGGPAIPLIGVLGGTPDAGGGWLDPPGQTVPNGPLVPGHTPGGFYNYNFCFLYKYDPADERSSVDLVDPPIIKKKKQH